MDVSGEETSDKNRWGVNLWAAMSLTHSQAFRGPEVWRFSIHKHCKWKCQYMRIAASIELTPRLMQTPSIQQVAKPSGFAAGTGCKPRTSTITIAVPADHLMQGKGSNVNVISHLSCSPLPSLPMRKPINASAVSGVLLGLW